nr:hypothetical protein [Tanacetum cinerariifolium]
MARHTEMYVISSHTKKIFANMRRIRARFSGVITPLFDSMMVQAAADMGDTPVKSHQTSIVVQPSTSKPQKPQKPRRKQRKETKTSHDESEDEDHVPTPSSDPLPSGEDSSILNELIVLCTSLQEQKQSQIHTVSLSKDKGKAKMIEPEVLIKRKQHMRIDEEYVKKLQAEEQEAARLNRAQQD